MLNTSTSFAIFRPVGSGAPIAPPPPVMEETFYLLDARGGNILTDGNGNRILWRRTS